MTVKAIIVSFEKGLVKVPRIGLNAITPIKVTNPEKNILRIKLTKILVPCKNIEQLISLQIKQLEIPDISINKFKIEVVVRLYVSVSVWKYIVANNTTALISIVIARVSSTNEV